MDSFFSLIKMKKQITRIKKNNNVATILGKILFCVEKKIFNSNINLLDVY